MFKPTALPPQHTEQEWRAMRLTQIALTKQLAPEIPDPAPDRVSIAPEQLEQLVRRM
jgi:hypothetical protein